MHQLSSQKKLTILFLFAVCVSLTAAAFAPPSTLITGSGQVQPRVASITQQSAENMDLLSEKKGLESTADDIPRGGANISDPPPTLPSLSTYRKFALPCLGLWVSQVITLRASYSLV